ncbi:DUF6320 domain-containing protein [Acetivibrio straminisolvens]|jgi:hypothetical protein|uniref:Uncharacterized protein n=1 Tax=Acetivibrio straminisolvens JCM 21531 TaxID=1294263 RepID=W4VAU4_9FIRM|nr:DUF6320 domain-containing protein [Acetivibrio straminisolvens]GAE89874.1 hypothetical protein JCM21531_3441 [Acetivibrio straminisolvens JCM 21531]
MIYCNYCKIYIRDKKAKCPLCGNVLPENGRIEKAEDIFPVIPLTYERHILIRILIFISIVAIVASYVVYKIVPTNVNWPGFVLFGLLSVWLSLIYALRKRYNITKSIMWQVIIVSGLVIFWDWKIGWMGWSLDYAVPFLCIAAMLVMYITAKVMKLSARDYISYFLLGGLFGIIPILFILFDLVKVNYPSYISVAASIIFLSAIIIFHGDSIKEELRKRMHI